VSTETSPIASPPVLNREHLWLYLLAVRERGLQSEEAVADELGLHPGVVTTGIDRLLDLGLLRRDVAGRLVPINPAFGAGALISTVELEIRERQQFIDDVRRQVDTFLPLYVAGRQAEQAEQPTDVETLTSAAEVMGALHRANESCRESIVGIRCGGWPQAGDDALTYDLSLLRRGVEAALIYHHRTRVDLSDKRRIKQLVAAGASVRTDDYLSRSMAIFDRRVAFVFGGDPAAPHQATVVRDPGTIAFLGDIFERMWHDAAPYDTGGAGYGGVLDDMHGTIARMLANGMTDEVVARRLGLSVRTVRRHIADLFRHLDAVSRFQAGARAASRGLLEG
jgi:DNA-binding CsgD family transcriptional regulator